MRVRKIAIYISIIIIFTLFVLPFSESNLLYKMVSIGSHKEVTKEPILSKSEMTRSVLINEFGQYFVDAGYPELRSGLYYDDLGDEAKAIIAIEIDADEENAFRIKS